MNIDQINGIMTACQDARKQVNDIVKSKTGLNLMQALVLNCVSTEKTEVSVIKKDTGLHYYQISRCLDFLNCQQLISNADPRYSLMKYVNVSAEGQAVQEKILKLEIELTSVIACNKLLHRLI